MNTEQFRRVLTAFADHSGNLSFGDDRVVVQVRDESIEAGVRESGGEVFVRENGEELRASSWITDRVARLPQLADRILENIPEEPHFVPPAGTLLDRLDPDRPAPLTECPDALRAMDDLLSAPAPGKSTVLYLASGTGGGKTTLIRRAARVRAKRFKNRESDFLVLPISLAGRNFLSFDDIVIAEFVGRLRFPFFYYEAFVELVKMGVVVPAFDGFEEMFVESSVGEAAIALGRLIHDLDSSGAVVLAVRRALFEYRNFTTQAQLFEAMEDRRAGFARIRLDGWSRGQFVRYADRRALPDPEEVHERIENRLGAGHPFLTRAALVARLVDAVEDGGSDGEMDALLDRLGDDPTDCFHDFVDDLVTREANEVWLDRSGGGGGGTGRPLLTVGEHHALLARLALDMWMFAADVLKGELVDSAAELFSEHRGHSPELARQVARRIRGHALLSAADRLADTYAFDHDDFRHFYLGQALAGIVSRPDPERMLHEVLLPRSLPRLAADETANALRREGADLPSVAARLQTVVSEALRCNDVRDNAGAILMRLLELREDAAAPPLVGFGFPADALRGRRPGRARFEECVFRGTALDGSDLSRCRFHRCVFVRLEAPAGYDAGGAVLEDCEVECLVSDEEPDGLFDPERIAAALEKAGFAVEGSPAVPDGGRASVTPETKLAERALRCFLRAPQVSEEMLRRDIGARNGDFFDRVLPGMLARGVLQEVSGEGNGGRRRFGLGVPMRRIAEEVPTTASSLDGFLDSLGRGR